jgi:hypothetical protein
MPNLGRTNEADKLSRTSSNAMFLFGHFLKHGEDLCYETVVSGAVLLIGATSPRHTYEF